MREHVALDLADRVDRDVDDDQEAGAAKLERKARLRDEIFGDQTDRRQIGRTEHGDARQYEIEIGGGVLARADAGNEAVLLFEIVGGFFGIEDDRDVEEAEEDDARGIERHIERLAVRSEEHTSELQSLMRISYAVFCLKKKKN